MPGTSLIARDYVPRRSDMPQEPLLNPSFTGASTSASTSSTTSTSTSTTDNQSSGTQWDDIEPLATRPRVIAFPCPLPVGTYQPRKISHFEDKELQTELRRGGADLYDPNAKKESPRGEAWRRTRRTRIERMIKDGELSEETVEMVRKLWLRNPPGETIVVKRARKPKPKIECE
jgi:hypothetical protein